MKKRILFIITMIISIFILSSCGGSNEYKGNTATVNFYFNGGQCRQLIEKISYTYKLGDLESTKIYQPQQIDEEDQKKRIYK